MSVPESGDTGSDSSLFSSLRSFWAVLVAILSTRLDLATTELEEVGTHAMRTLVTLMAALLCGFMTIFFIFFFLVIAFPAERVMVLGIISGVCILASLILVLAARHLILTWPKFLGQTLEELKRDAASLRAITITKKEES